MSIKTRASNRVLGIVLIALTLYLGLYTWNARTGVLDTVAESSGLEIVGYVLSPFVWVKDQVTSVWDHYFALVDVAEENSLLREQLKQAEARNNLSREEKAELDRLRLLFGLPALRENPGFAARVIARQFGSQSVFKTLAIDKGFLDGAIAGTPVISVTGAVGRVFRSAPHAATILLLTDPGCRVAVISQETRTPGVAVGLPGDTAILEVRYVGQVAALKPGELLVTSGVDGQFPKGIPVARVTSVEQTHDTLFLTVQAQPVVDLNYLEEVVLLSPANSGQPLVQGALPAEAEPAASENAPAASSQNQ